MGSLTFENISQFYRGMVQSLVYCFLRGDLEVKRLLTLFDSTCSESHELMMLNINLEHPENIELRINNELLVITPTAIRRRMSLLYTLSDHIVFLLGISNERTGLSKRIEQNIINGITKSITVTPNGKEGFNVFINGTNNTSRMYPVLYSNITGSGNEIPLMKTVIQ